jgi:DNA-binding NtrC family response regulator
MNRLLIADDEECLLLAYRKLLSGPGVEIDTAQSAPDAKKLIAINLYSVMIVDLRLAGSVEMEGLDIIADAHQLYPESKIIVLTAYGDNRIKECVLNAGANYFFEKPISVLVIRDLLSTLGLYTAKNTHPIFDPKYGSPN